MLDAKLIERLRAVTPEEQRLLGGARTVERELYTSGGEFVVDSAKMLGAGRLIDIRMHTRFVEFPMHKHNYIEISYMCRGKTTHILNGGTAVELSEGDLLFLNKHAFHQILPAGEEDLCVNFIILPQFFDVAMDMMRSENVLSDFLSSSLRERPGEHDILYFRVADVLPVRNLVENLVFSMLYPAENGDEIDRATMGVLLLQLLEHTDRAEDVGPGRENDFLVASTLRYVEEHYRDGTLTELAAQLRQSLSALSKAVSRGTGKTFGELVREKRLARAEQLLRYSRLTVSEIIEAVGYENTSYFYRIFRRAYGVSPRQFRLNPNGK